MKQKTIINNNNNTYRNNNNKLTNIKIKITKINKHLMNNKQQHINIMEINETITRLNNN